MSEENNVKWNSSWGSDGIKEEPEDSSSEESHESREEHHGPALKEKLSGFKPSFSVPNMPNFNFNGGPSFSSGNDNLKYGAIALVVLLVGAYMLGIPQQLLMSSEQEAINIANSNSFVQDFKEGKNLDVSAQEFKGLDDAHRSGDIPRSATNVYAVDYVSDQGISVTAFVDLDKNRVVDTDYMTTVG